jgi:hypothetical protein
MDFTLHDFGNSKNSGIKIPLFPPFAKGDEGGFETLLLAAWGLLLSPAVIPAARPMPPCLAQFLTSLAR